MMPTRQAAWAGYRGRVADQVVRRWTVEEFFGNTDPPTDDDVPIALDGRRLDTPEKVIAYLEEINRNRAAPQRAD
jgi:hypothetical protein